jgi:hypothetical protein
LCRSDAVSMGGPDRKNLPVGRPKRRWWAVELGWRDVAVRTNAAENVTHEQIGKKMSIKFIAVFLLRRYSMRCLTLMGTAMRSASAAYSMPIVEDEGRGIVLLEATV